MTTLDWRQAGRDYFTLDTRSRLPLPDALRGLAIVLMAIFHGWYDLSVFGFVEMDFDDPFVRGFRGIIVGLFCLMAGASLYWTHQRGIRWQSLKKRQGQLIASAALLSVFSLLAYPEAWIYFGILHFFVIALLISLPMVRMPVVAGVLGATLVLAERLGLPWTDPWLHDYLHPILGLPDGTIDRMYLLPWLGVVWVGIWLARQPIMAISFSNSLNRSTHWLRWMGQRPLSLYLIHQPILFGLAALLWLAFG
ncbi:MAG: DUF1624 domain-containing protein [Natronospirillum sp.]|uniref:heparan-alpha-glucosaminide N-acetyltransferase n=1 Tax=Natronospirillum sp. TaxID=2812955 RepID=UPI0025DD68F1|nr:heparan-alpha-glucosaminide N-acetyltransferase [Natronospirillum sp.]MCH8550654.1 DUF1624 domain-containing protein [Natronospirillum sp.]